MRRPAGGAVLFLLLLFVAAGCGREGGAENGENGQSNLSGRISADGSSTVGPLTTAAAERFRRTNPKVRITVG
ncbi:MAG TPA: hypothetical protein VE620_07330, partial [Myxococcales bacterium]|nr:hypothetical protein [Myxococcales bacterium]